ncbi:MAG: DNA ligase [Myxococcales bacterium]|nr:DNA ligase [Myxococcales bacterium]
MASDLRDGETTQVKGSGSSIYTLKNSGGVYSCTCPAWMHQGIAIERRTCKHLRAFRGDEAEEARLGSAPLSGKPTRAAAKKSSGEDVAPPVLLAHPWENDVDLTGWWISEKLDGVRAWWDGRRFLSRLGNQFFAPTWFTEGLPNHPLDGELWGGRKLFQRTVGIVKRQDESPLWKELSYVVFDAPAHGGVFEERTAFLEQSVAGRKVAWLQACAHLRCEGVDHLRRELARVEALGGEGLMARQPGSRYEAGRSSTLLKVKSFHDDEARVIDHLPGAGRHKGRLGALLVELADGTQFSVGTGFSDREREAPPKVGAVITFRYQELSNAGVPRFPSFVGERIDKVMAPSSPSPKARRVKAVTAPSTPPPASVPRSGKGRRFELVAGTSSKFWEISVDGAAFTTTYGRIGSKGQTTLKSFGSAAQAQAEAEKLIAEKTKKGYRETAG